MNFESIDPEKLDWSDCEFSPQKRKKLKTELLSLIREGQDLIKKSEEKLSTEPVTLSDMVFFEIEPPDDIDEENLIGYLDSFSNTEPLPKHKSTVKTFQCEECKLIFYSKHLLGLHVKERHLELQCNFCESIAFFKTTVYLKDHLQKIHNEENNNTCKICKKAFKQFRYLKAHELNVHGDLKSLCRYCGIFFKNTTLENHYRIHRNERNHKCDMCDSSFIKKSDLIVHIRLHTGERPYKCKICDEKFIANTNLNKHMKSKHRVSSVECNNKC